MAIDLGHETVVIAGQDLDTIDRRRWHETRNVGKSNPF